MWKWLGGMSPLQWVSLVRNVIRYAIIFAKWAERTIRRKKEKENLEEIQEARQQNEEANKIEDDQQRLKEKANAAKKTEDALARDPYR